MDITTHGGFFMPKKAIVFIYSFFKIPFYNQLNKNNLIFFKKTRKKLTKFDTISVDDLNWGNRQIFVPFGEKMQKFLLDKRLLVVLLSAILIVVLVGYTMRDRLGLTWPEMFVKDTIGLVQSSVNGTYESVAGYFENMSDLKNTYEENKVLKVRLEDYVKVQTEKYKLEKKVKELQKIIGIKDNLKDYEVTYGSEIGRSADLWNETIIINKGSSSGIKANMAVMTADGLVGKIKSATQFTSTVQLLTSNDQSNRVSAEIQDQTSVFGFIQGYDTESKCLIFKCNELNMDIKNGSHVISSGKGGVFPPGLPIGSVKKTTIDAYGLNKIAYIEPFANFYDINQVVIVKRISAQVDVGTSSDGDL